MNASLSGWDCHVHVFDASRPVRAGHYHPTDRRLHEIEALARAQGIGHLVLVQPSVYGHDNSLLLDSLASRPDGRHRGVAVLNGQEDEATLDRMHVLGVRGVRFNLVSPVGESAEGAQEWVLAQVRTRLASLAPRLRQRGWHVQWYLNAGWLPAVAGLQDACGLRFVIDHFAAAQGSSRPAPWAADAADALTRLARSGAFIKLSAPYRLGARPPYTELRSAAMRLHRLFDGRVLMGSDWPHTSLAAAEMPDYETQLRWQRALVPGLNAHDLAAAAESLYG